MKKFSTFLVWWVLTSIKLGLRLFVVVVLKVNIPVVPKGSVTNGSKKGILTLTLLVSRSSVRPPVTRWLCVMNFKFLQVKTKLQSQVEDYIAWKEKKGVDVDRYGTVSKFITYMKGKDSIEDIHKEDLQKYYEYVNTIENTKYFINETMKDIRVMYRWFKARRFNVVDPDIIGERGLTVEAKSDTLDYMTEPKTRIGRPPKIELIKKVKSLRDINKLSFREIARVIRKDVSQVHVWYYYDLTKSELIS